MRLRRTTNPYKPVQGANTGYECVLYGADLYGSDPNEWCAVIDIGKLGRSDFEIEFQWSDVQALIEKFHQAGHPEAIRLFRGKELLELVDSFQRRQ